ncbi:MAG TPA: ParB/RepB/Spo0J family partition protein [Stellaceae bacterium]|nr:ParB/RepB/Spo0J family partition protein [Stellaceae bacterium]
MNSPAAPWQLDRLSTNARAAAESASRAAGMSLAAWLTKLISDTCAAEGVASLAEPPRILELMREIPGRALSPRIQPTPAQPMAFRAPPLAIAPVTAYRTLGIAPTPAQPTMQRTKPTLQPQAAAPVAASSTAQPVPAGATPLSVAALVAADLGTRGGDDVPEPLLADIATRGVRQPVVVRRSASNLAHYEIICGHRRWRAARRAGFAQIPAIVVVQDDATAILASLSENLQLENLSAIDEAQAYLRLLTQCNVDIAAVTAASGRDRTHIVQSMRLLGLPPLVRHLINGGLLSREHAFVLLDAPQPEGLADAIIAEQLSGAAARQRLAAGAKSNP